MTISISEKSKKQGRDFRQEQENTAGILTPTPNQKCYSL